MVADIELNDLQPRTRTAECLSPHLSANQLAALAADGCNASFDELQRIYWPRLLHVVRSRLLLELCDCEDICQEAFVKAYQNIKQFDPRYQFSTWLFTIGLRTGKDFLRRHHSKFNSISLQQISVESKAIPLQRNSAADHIQVEELWREVKSALTAEQYLAMWLRYGEELSIMEVAKVLDRTQIGVRVILHRARGRLTSTLKPGLD
jgi:RNA polymerase sigma-70 factor (ECF subfamily)